MTEIKTLTDEECLTQFLKFLEERVTIETGFLPDDEGNITHQVIQVTCGEYTSVSQPEPLAVSLRLASAEESGQTVN